MSHKKIREICRKKSPIWQKEEEEINAQGQEEHI
jgi:hypothetical protein